MADNGLARFELLDWKRTVAELYASVRADPDPAAAWARWRETRDRLFARHPRSPIPAARREAFEGLRYFGYDPGFRAIAELAPASQKTLEIPTSTGGVYGFTRCAIASFSLDGEPLALSVYWLDGYGGGVFLSFRDATSGKESYGACRYLLDTVKGSDLGMQDGLLVLDFNFAYNPSCAYDPRWTCPLAPPDNRLAFPIAAGERAPAAHG